MKTTQSPTDVRPATTGVVVGTAERAAVYRPRRHGCDVRASGTPVGAGRPAAACETRGGPIEAFYRRTESADPTES